MKAPLAQAKQEIRDRDSVIAQLTANHNQRVKELLEANNALLERARAAEAEAERLKALMDRDYRELVSIGVRLRAGQWFITK